MAEYAPLHVAGRAAAPVTHLLGAMQGSRRWRSEYLALAVVALIVGVFALLFFGLGMDLADLKHLGYLGVFLIALIGSASVILPLPGAAVVVTSGQFLDDVGPVPFWLMVGIVASAGEALGELTGYLAGVGGKAIIGERPAYQGVQRWMERRGTATIFVLSVIPNPVFDIAGFMAGAVRMPLWTFLSAVFVGKTIKNALLALGGDAGIDVLVQAFD